MKRIPTAFKAVALLLLLIVLPWTAAAEPPHRIAGASKPYHGSSSVAAPLNSLWKWLTSLWDKNGCMIDPDGRCISGAAPAQPTSTDNRCGLDPGGRCKS